MNGRFICTSVFGLALAAIAPNALRAQTQSTPNQLAKDSKTEQVAKPAPAATPAQKGVLDDSLPKWLRITGTIRGRWEDTIVAMKGNVNDGAYLNRVRLDITVQPTPWLTLVGQVQDTRDWGYNHGVPSAALQNPLDLRVAYVQLGGGESRGQWIRAGRQELLYGAGRLFSAGEWNNTAKSFDVVRGEYYRPGVKLDFVAGSIVLLDPSRFDRHKPGEHFYGTYETFDKLVRGMSVEPYFFAKTINVATGELGSKGDALLVMGGLRLAGKAPGRMDYSFEMLHQGGTYAKDHISAWGGTYTLGWTVVRSGWKPRVSADYSFASGDKNSKDGMRGTFDLMYGNNQPFYGLTGLFGWKNIRTTRAGMDFAPLKRLTVLIDYRDYNLNTVQDGLYNASGTQIFMNRKATSAHVGEGLDAQFAYAWPKGITTSIGLGSVFCGTYLHEVAQKDTYLYPYFMWSKRF